MPGPVNPKSKKGTVNPAGIVRGSGGTRVASPSATPRRGRGRGQVNRPNRGNN